MALYIYNTMTRTKEQFKPLVKGQVRMYVCGPTVYNLLHVGNFRGAVFYNLVRNWLEKCGHEVNYVFNFTDVDDKIINRAQEEGVTAQEISEKYITEFKKDYKALGLRPHTSNPKVSDNMDAIVDFIKELIEKEKAYDVDGDVYYSVSSFDDYGKLSNKKIDELESGHRIDADDNKKAPEDFALWKKSKPGEPEWDSPWSKGRPGWHIECSAMSRKLLGDCIDIHGGGLDLVFPHHENEIAQSEGCSGHTSVKYWVHHNMIEFDKQKMSKSLGNIKTLRDFLKEYNAEIYKYLMSTSHYRSIIDFSPDQVDRSIQSLAKFYSALKLAKDCMSLDQGLVPVPDKFHKIIDEADDKITRALNDDFNTPELFAALFDVTREFNKRVRTPGAVSPEKSAISEVYYAWIRSHGELLALFQKSAGEFLMELDDMLLAKKGHRRIEVDKLVDERTQARHNKDYAKSDEIRAQLQALGIAVQDTKDGSVWEVAK